MTRNQKEYMRLVVEYLRRLARERKGLEYKHGICDNLNNSVNLGIRGLMDDFSECLDFPIKDPNCELDSYKIYMKAQLNETLWVGDYGSKRIELCNHLANYIERCWESRTNFRGNVTWSRIQALRHIILTGGRTNYEDI